MKFSVVVPAHNEEALLPRGLRAFTAEDLDSARRLRAHGRRTDRRFTMLRTAPIVSSCRKFDRFGDWHMFRMALQAREIRAVMKGTDTAWVDRYFFDFND